MNYTKKKLNSSIFPKNLKEFFDKKNKQTSFDVIALT